MRPIPLLLILMLILTLGAGCSADYLPFSSGALAGVEQTNPGSFVEVGARNVIQLETRTDTPYSVNLWVIGKTDHLYVFAGDNRATWVEHIEVNPAVRLRSGEDIYLLQAERVTDAEEFVAFADAWEAKYGRRPRNENVDETYLFRLTPRI